MGKAENERGFYSDYHHGISMLFETTLVYVVVRKLLERNFPMEARWEDGYPSSRQLVDLVLADQGEKRIAIECKFWKTDDARDLKADAAKLAGAPDSCVRLLLTIWREPDDPEVNLKWLGENGFKPLHHRTFKTHFRGRRGKDSWTGVIALLECAKEV
jgi:hypothetical protein